MTPTYTILGLFLNWKAILTTVFKTSVFVDQHEGTPSGRQDPHRLRGRFHHGRGHEVL